VFVSSVFIDSLLMRRLRNAFHPLYPSVSEAAERNPALGELLALFDAVRGGRRVVAVSSSVSAMDALRARIRAQSKTVADHIAADPEAQGFIDDWATPEAHHPLTTSVELKAGQIVTVDWRKDPQDPAPRAHFLAGGSARQEVVPPEAITQVAPPAALPPT
jgi:hypothetical protein